MRKSLIFVFVVAMFFLSLLFLGWSGLLKLQEPPIQSLLLNRKGNAFFLTENYQSAFDNYVKTLQFEPFSPETHLNLGLTYEAQQQAEKAQTSYQNALKYAKERDLQFMALFNSAQLLGKAKKIDPALELYQKALALRPDSKEVKTNIELLIQQQQQDGGKGDKDQEPKDQKDKNDKKDQKDGKDPKDDQNKESQDQGQKDEKEKDSEKGKDKDKPQQYGQNPKPQPKKFDSKELSEADVKKILAELKQQEQKIRGEFNRKEVKEQPRDKDW